MGKIKIKKSGQSQQCRCCLKEIGLKELWTEYYNGEEREVYGEMVNDCFALPWEPLFGKTEHICDGCIGRLRDAVSFKREILYSNQLLNQQAKNESKLSVKQEEESDVELETEYLSIEYMDDDDDDKDKNLMEIKIEQESKLETSVKEEASPSKRGKRYTEDDLKKCMEAVMSGKMSQTKASIVYHVPRKTISAAVAKMPAELGGKLPHRRDKLGLKKRQDNLDSLILFTNATPFRDVRNGHICYFCHFQHDADTLKIHTIENHLRNQETAIKIKVISDKSVKLDITDLTCEICGDSLPTLESAFDHLRLKHEVEIHTDSKDHLVPFKFDGKTQKCVVCNLDFQSFKLLNDHINLNHYKNYECKICGRGFINKRSLQAHGYIHETGEFPCKYCDETFTIRTRLIQHEKYVHLDKKKRNKCLYCEEKFLDVTQKDKHESEIHGIDRRMYQCNSCEKVYYSRHALQRHTVGFHLKMRPYKCTECDARFFTRNTLNTHMVRHTGEKSFQCDVCKKRYGRRSTLAEHLRIHANDRRYKCEVCGKRFVQKCSWRGHMRNKHKCFRNQYENGSANGSRALVVQVQE